MTALMAKAISEKLEPPEQSNIQSLVDLAEVRLGPEHPLCQVLKRGVAYHHGALPAEIRASIEEAVCEGHLRFLVATTTLTEGVNLPVQSVVVASQGFRRGPEDYVEYITGPKLINAIGRAGRAAQETEGIVVLARRHRLKPADFRQLDPHDADTQVSSMLTSERALNALAAFEELQRTAEDAVIETATGEVSEFLTFVWFIAAELERLGKLPSQEQVREVLKHSLAWVQLTPEDKERWLAVAGVTLSRYQATNPAARRRWAAAGTTISSASKTEAIARELATILRNTQVPQDPVEAVGLIMGEGRIERILRLPEAPKRRFYTRRSGKDRPEVAIPMEALLRQLSQIPECVICYHS